MRIENSANDHGSAVSVRGLTRVFGDFIAVDGIDLTVPKGSIFGFLGPNGAGKSTTIRMLCGLLLPTGGSGTVAGWDIFTATERIKQSIGYLSQRFSLYDDLTVEENIDFFGGLYGVTGRRRADRKRWALELSGLAGRSGALTRTLPVGFKQRLALCCAILHEPPLLFLDEPTSGVDPLSRRRFWDLIGSLARSGVTVFVTTHYLDEADYCDQLALIYRGRIIARGSPRQLRSEHMRGEVLEIAVDAAAPALELLQRNGYDAAVFGSRIHAIVPSAAEASDGIRRTLEAGSIRVDEVMKIPPSLEDVFVGLIEQA